MKLDEIFKAIENNLEVCWSNDSYKVHFVESNGSQYAKFSEVGDKCLRVTCKSNYFGSYVSESDLGSCYVNKGGVKNEKM